MGEEWPQLWCWRNMFVYQQCCDTSTYGSGGFDFCFAQVGLSFHQCCPAPIAQLQAGQAVEVVPSWWEYEHRGCDSNFHWLATSLANSIYHGPSYDPHSGEVVPSFSAIESNISELNGMQVVQPGRDALELYLFSTKDYSFRAFLHGAATYYDSGELNVELLQLLHEIVTRFGDAFNECPSAAILAGLMKAEILFDRERELAMRLTRSLRTLVSRSMRRNEVKLEASWPGYRALSKLAQLANRTVLSHPILVDLVIPICALSELKALSSSLQVAFRPQPQALQKAAVEFSLHLYDLCGLLQSWDNKLILEAVFGQLPYEVRQLFGRCPAQTGSYFRLLPCTLQRVRVVQLVEEVPTGDVAAYLRHLADASAKGILADVTMLLHPDFAEHVREGMLDQVFGGLVAGAFPHLEIDFLNLGWRHEGPVQDGQRVASHVLYHCWTNLLTQRLECHGSSSHPLAREATSSEYNPVLLENLWDLAFGQPFDAAQDNFGGHDFSQLLVSRKAVLRRPSSYWLHLSKAVSARESYERLPGTRFISRRVDLTPLWSFNKGVCIWFEHMWHLLFDARFSLERTGSSCLDEPASQGTSNRVDSMLNCTQNTPRRDLRAFTRLGDRSLPLGLRRAPDGVMLRHYLLSAEEQCSVLHDRQGCYVLMLKKTGRS